MKRLNITIIFISLFLISSCASNNAINKNGITKNMSLTPVYKFKQGNKNIIKPGAITWKQNEYLALLPAGPYVYQRKKLKNEPVDFTSHDQYAFVITTTDKTSSLHVLYFPPIGQTKTVSKVDISVNAKNIYYASNRLLITGKNGDFEIIDVATPDTPHSLLYYSLNHHITDVQFDGKFLFVLQENNALLQFKITTNESHTLLADVQRSWHLPFTASAIEIRDDYAWITGSEGIRVLKLGNQNITISDSYETTGRPLDIQITNNLLFLANDTGGLVIFDIANKDKLQWKGSYNKRGAVSQISIQKPSPINSDILVTLDNNAILLVSTINPELPGSGPVYKPLDSIITSAFFQNDVLLLTKDEIQRIKMLDAGTRAVSPEGVNQGGSRRGVIRDNILFVADWFSGLHLYDISIPQQPRHLANYHTPGSSKGVTLYGNYALIGDDDQGLQIVDIENPHKPIWVSELTPDSLSGEGLAYTMKRVGKILYLADHRGGFHIIDLSDIYHPKRLGGYDTPGKSWGIDVVNNYVFVADDQSGLLIFDVTNSSDPKLVSRFDPGGQAEDVAIQDDLAYVAFFDKGLYVLDVNNPLKPIELGHTPIPGNARGIELADGLAYVAGWESGLHMVDTRGPNTPRIIGTFDTDGSAWGVNVKDGYAYVLDWWGGIKVIDVRQPSKPSYVGQYHARGTLQQLRAHNRYMYAASGAGGLQIFDMKNPLNPIWITGIDIHGHASDIWHDDSRAYVAAGDGGVIMLDTLDPFYTWRIGQIDTPGIASQVRGWNDIAFIRDSRAGIMVVDVRNPQRPQEIGRLDINPLDLWVDDNAFWASTAKGLTWWPHESDYQIDLSHHLPIDGGSDWVRTQGHRVITASRTGTVQIWQLTPQGLERMGEFHAGENLLDIQIDGQLLYALGEITGLMVIDIQNPHSPYLVTAYSATGEHTGIEIAGGAAFFAGENKMASVTLLPTPTQKKAQSGENHLQLPPDLPTGQYHLMKVNSKGQKILFPNALSVRYDRPGTTTPTLERYRQLLKGPQ